MKNQSLTITGAITTIATIVVINLKLNIPQEHIADLVLAISIIFQQLFMVIHGRARKGDVDNLGRRKKNVTLKLVKND